mgnify:CR=1 FL=1
MTNSTETPLAIPANVKAIITKSLKEALKLESSKGELWSLLIEATKTAKDKDEAKAWFDTFKGTKLYEEVNPPHVKGTPRKTSTWTSYKSQILRALDNGVSTLDENGEPKTQADMLKDNQTAEGKDDPKAKTENVDSLLIPSDRATEIKLLIGLSASEWQQALPQIQAILAEARPIKKFA